MEGRPKLRALMRMWNIPTHFYHLFDYNKYFKENLEELPTIGSPYKTSGVGKAARWGVPYDQMVKDFANLNITEKDILEIYARMQGMGTMSFVWSWEYATLSHIMPWPTINYGQVHWQKMEKILENV